MKNKIDLIIPCYNESQVINIFYDAVKEVIKNINNYDFCYIFIDDGSLDNSLEILKELAQKDENVKYISFSRNFGKEAAMYAGLKKSSGNMCLIMDVDMQNPPGLIPKMIQGIEEGFDCCGGYRLSRKGESKLKVFFANRFYNINNKISEVNMPNGVGDFRIMTRQMVDAILAMSEVQRFSKGIFSWVGFKTKWIAFENVERVAGTTKWSFFKLFSYAIDGITAFSIFPLRLASFLGVLISISSFIYLTAIVIKTIFLGKDIPGYASIITLLLFIGGIIILTCGILGEYIGRIYIEVKKRPIYIIKQTNID